MRLATNRRLLSIRLLLVHALLIVAVESTVVSGASEKKVALDEVKARLDRARTPVERVLIQIQISDLLLREVKDNVSLNDTKSLSDWLEQYRETISMARETILNSGRDPQREPDGFKHLEIQLRQHITWLISWKRKATDSKPIEESIAMASSIQKEMLDLLFPIIGEKKR